MSFGSRLVADLVDLLFWAGPGGSDVTTATTIQVPESVEAGIGYGLLGIAWPIASGGASSLARAMTGKRPEPLQHIPHVGAVIGGTFARLADQRRLSRARELHQAELSAKSARAYLAGQNEMAMGASSIIDQLKPVALMLGSDRPGSALNQVRAGWKESLAERAQQHAVFLDSGVRLWQQLHNDHPDLSGYVDVVDIAEGDGTTLLTGYQVASLARLLESRELGHRVEIAVARRRTRPVRPGKAFDLLVNGEVVTVPADRSATIDRFNAAPAAFAFGAWAALMPTRADDGGLPTNLALVCSASYLIAAVRYLGLDPEEAARESLVVSFALSVLQGVICVAGCKTSRKVSGAQMFHGTYGLTPAALLVGARWGELDVPERRRVLGVISAIGLAAYIAEPGPRSPLDFAAAVAYPLAALVGMRAMAGAVTRESEELSAELSREDEKVEARAFGEGARHVLALAFSALSEAETEFAAAVLDDDLRDAIVTRLRQIRQLGEQLAGDAAGLA